MVLPVTLHLQQTTCRQGCSSVCSMSRYVKAAEAQAMFRQAFVSPTIFLVVLFFLLAEPRLGFFHSKYYPDRPSFLFTFIPVSDPQSAWKPRATFAPSSLKKACGGELLFVKTLIASHRSQHPTSFGLNNGCWSCCSCRRHRPLCPSP